ncbi:hypothetical protein NDU88_001276 [Pleurodeles waltl]|uniref:Uncharacterized protein n=1 Tax=Pleurodeles waltl TaxID=8319 RepID=A0AAV7UVM8_PLEWA|nr:hypothetical protein NDU88_001276 [Pleurodeles waltl]
MVAASLTEARLRWGTPDCGRHGKKGVSGVVTTVEGDAFHVRHSPYMWPGASAEEIRRSPASNGRRRARLGPVFAQARARPASREGRVNFRKQPGLGRAGKWSPSPGTEDQQHASRERRVNFRKQPGLGRAGKWSPSPGTEDQQHVSHEGRINFRKQPGLGRAGKWSPSPGTEDQQSRPARGASISGSSLAWGEPESGVFPQH